MDMRSAIEGRLKTLNPQIFEFQDDSHLHKGHAGNKGGGALCCNRRQRGFHRDETYRTPTHGSKPAPRPVCRRFHPCLKH